MNLPADFEFSPRLLLLAHRQLVDAEQVVVDENGVDWMARFQLWYVPARDCYRVRVLGLTPGPA